VFFEEIHFDIINSTQSWAKKHYAQLPTNTLISASQQTHGLGQFQRPWISPDEENIYATFYFTLPEKIADLTHLSQLATLTVVQVLQKRGFAPKIKPPNDILLAEKKMWRCFIGNHFQQR